MATADLARRRRWWPALALAVVAVIVFVLVWFQPHKLFIDDTVDDPFPVASDDGATATTDEPAVATSGPGATAAPATEPVALVAGSFRSLDHSTAGQATIYELADGSRILRFEDFETDNGPDLRVYLSVADADADEGAFDDDFVDLGGLRGNIGNQNYELPADLDLDRFQSVVIWCRRFSAGFGVAPLV